MKVFISSIISAYDVDHAAASTGLDTRRLAPSGSPASPGYEALVSHGARQRSDMSPPDKADREVRERVPVLLFVEAEVDREPEDGAQSSTTCGLGQQAIAELHSEPPSIDTPP